MFLKNFVAANPSKSAYGFTLNRKRPGHFNLCFLANKNSTVQTWVSPHGPFYGKQLIMECLAGAGDSRGLLPVRNSGSWCPRTMRCVQSQVSSVLYQQSVLFNPDQTSTRITKSRRRWSGGKDSVWGADSCTDPCSRPRYSWTYVRTPGARSYAEPIWRRSSTRWCSSSWRYYPLYWISNAWIPRTTCSASTCAEERQLGSVVVFALRSLCILCILLVANRTCLDILSHVDYALFLTSCISSKISPVSSYTDYNRKHYFGAKMHDQLQRVCAGDVMRLRTRLNEV